jgi:tetratricopeptide (TPR) repeat protein
MTDPLQPNLQAPADTAATTAPDTPDATVPPAPATAAHRYALGEEIARGGMGVIWRALDTTLGREVAVKVLHDKYGPDSVIARRFADEARITAQLQHPAIPPVHDLGTLPDGRPFLAMKLIKGQTLDELLSARSDPSAERGRLVAVFEQVCQAVAYAHAHGVIHRDLKPANVMVGAFGEVQLMDWGLAKVLASRESPRPPSDPDATLVATRVVSLRDSDGMFTQAGSVLGTPSYMPPEQAIGAVNQIDAQSDVFGLGAILAVILTGRPPFRGDTSESTRQLAAMGKVQDCFSRLEGCGADPELIALCKHCLAPEKADRPADGGAAARAVAALRAAADERARRAELDKVRVEGEKAAAEARSLERRKRRRLWLGAAAALVLALVGGLSAVLAVQQRANADLAVKNKELADEQAKVQARFELAQKAIATFHSGVSEDVLLKNAQFKDLRTRLLKEAAGFYDDLEKLLEGQTDAKSRRLLAEGYFHLGELTEKIGSRAEALGIHRKALAIRRELAAAADADVPTRLDVAHSLWAVGWLLFDMGDMAGALAAYEEQRDIAQALEVESPTDAVRAVLARSYHSIGYLLLSTGKRPEALTEYEKARDIWEKLVEANPTHTDFQSDLAQIHDKIGEVLWQTGKRAEALGAWQQTRVLRQKLADANPTRTNFQNALVHNYTNIGLALTHLGKQAEALEALEQARAIGQKLVDGNPAVTNFQSGLAWSHFRIGDVLRQTGKPAEARTAYEKAQVIWQKLADANPAVARLQYELAISHGQLGILLEQTRELPESLAAHRRAHTILQKLVEANPTVSDFQSDLAESFYHIGNVLWQLREPAEALESHRKARVNFQKAADASPRNAVHLAELANSENRLGRLLARQGQFGEAFAALDKGLDRRQKLADANPKNPVYTKDLGYSHADRGAAHVRAGHPAEAAADLRRAIALWDKLETPESETRFERSRALALLAGLGADARSGVTAIEAARFADQAVATLQDALQSGWAQLDELKEPDFDPLRKRADFQKLVQELEAKAAAARRTKPNDLSQKEEK